MAIDISTDQLISGYSRFFHRYHVILFVIIALGGLSIVVFLLYQTVQSSTDTANITQDIVAGFDNVTIERLKSLDQTGGSEPLEFPKTRINPFVE